MTETRLHIEATLEEVWLDLDEVCRLTRLPADWVRAHVSGGLLMVAFGAGDDWRFDAQTLRRAQRLAALERDFDAVPELAALVADLEDEVARLRQLALRPASA